MSNDRTRNIIRSYRDGIYSCESARRELVALGFTPEEASTVLARASTKSAVKNVGAEGKQSQ